MTDQKQKTAGKPRWLSRRLPTTPEYEQVRALVRDGRLHTVCQEANCPNKFECFSRRTATFMILGDRCTRNCRFCNVEHGGCTPPDPEEPSRVADAAARMGLRYVVVTSVTRDDLTDGGAWLFAETIAAIHNKIPGALVEVLIPDFQGNEHALATVLKARPDVLNHNVETVPRLYDAVRPQAVYQRSLDLLSRASQTAPEIPTKSGLMLGLGETDAEIRSTLTDIHNAGCRIITLGQYLRPSKDHHPVDRYVTPEAYDEWRNIAMSIGFAEAASGPFVRSSYKAENLLQAMNLTNGKHRGRLPPGA